MRSHRVLRVALAALVLLGVTSRAGAQGRVYATDSSSLHSFDPATLTLLGSVDLSSYGAPLGVAVAANGTRIYVGLAGSPFLGTGISADAVAVIDAASLTQLRAIAVGKRPAWLVASPDGSRVYVTNSMANTVTVIRTADDAVIATVPVGGTPEQLAISRDGAQLFVVNRADASVSQLSTATLAVTATFTNVTPAPEGIAVAPDGTRIFVADRSNSRTVAIDVASKAPVGSIQSSGPVALAITPAGKLYVTGQPVTVADASTLAVRRSARVRATRRSANPDRVPISRI